MQTKKTKIIATLGPAVIQNIQITDFKDYQKQALIQQTKEKIAKLYDKGVNVVRFNFSHGSYEEHYIRLKLAKEVALEKKINISTMLDTKGPEIRVFDLADGGIEIVKDSKWIILTTQKKIGKDNFFSVYDASGTYNMAYDVKIGDLIYIDDGKLSLKIEQIDVVNGEIVAIALNDWFLKTNKRINLPAAEYSIPFLSDKDRNDINFAIKHKFDYIAASFVNSADDVKQIRQILVENNASNIQIVAKIETVSAVKAIDEITEAADAIMIARGDLGLEIPYHQLPNIQKYIIKNCRYRCKAVIVATQMLDSLETKLLPTRAEITDVAYGVEKGADVLMLSGETANGINPLNAVKIMNNVIISSENFFDYDRAINHYFKHTCFYPTSVGKLAIKIALLTAPVRTIANAPFEFSGVYIFSNTSDLVKALSVIRCAAPIFFITSQTKYATQFGLNYGVFVKIIPDLEAAVKDYIEVVNAINVDLGLERNTLIVINNKIIFVEK